MDDERMNSNLDYTEICKVIDLVQQNDLCNRYQQHEDDEKEKEKIIRSFTFYFSGIRWKHKSENQAQINI